MAGRNLVPAERSLREDHDQNPFAVPSNVRRDAVAGSPGRSDRPATPEAATTAASRGSGPAVRHSGPDRDKLLADRRRLDGLDDRFRSMVAGDISTWNLDQLDREYRSLQQQAAHPALASQIDLRLAAFSRYRRRKQTWDELMKLTMETARRDAELLAKFSQQTGPSGQWSAPHPSSPASGEGAWQPTRPRQPGDSSSAGPMSHRTGRPAVQAAPFVAGPHGRTLDAAPQAAPRRTGFDGAGIIQRAATTYPGAPSFVLLAPDGRVLAYLQAAPGVALEPLVGRAMGLYGQRVYRPELQSDLIIVRGMAPVRLAPPAARLMQRPRQPP